jgi:hypothetical protein
VCPARLAAKPAAQAEHLAQTILGADDQEIDRRRRPIVTQRSRRGSADCFDFPFGKGLSQGSQTLAVNVKGQRSLFQQRLRVKFAGHMNSLHPKRMGCAAARTSKDKRHALLCTLDVRQIRSGLLGKREHTEDEEWI